MSDENPSGGHEALPNGRKVGVVDTSDSAVVLIIGFDGIGDLWSELGREDTARRLHECADALTTHQTFIIEGEK